MVVLESDKVQFQSILEEHQRTAPYPIRLETEPDLMNGHIQQKYSKVLDVSCTCGACETLMTTKSTHELGVALGRDAAEEYQPPSAGSAKRFSFVEVFCTCNTSEITHTHFHFTMLWRYMDRNSCMGCTRERRGPLDSQCLGLVSDRRLPKQILHSKGCGRFD